MYAWSSLCCPSQKGQERDSQLFVREAVSQWMMAFPGLVRARGEAVCKRVAPWSVAIESTIILGTVPNDIKNPLSCYPERNLMGVWTHPIS